MALEKLGYGSPDGSIARGLHSVVESSSGATKTLVAGDSGGIFLLDSATGITYTLPDAVVGMKFKFIATVSVTSNAYIIVTPESGVFVQGGIQQIIATSAVSEGQAGNGTSHQGITMNGTTRGGLKGTIIDVVCVTSGLWDFSGIAVSSGTLTTMFYA